MRMKLMAALALLGTGPVLAQEAETPDAGALVGDVVAGEEHFQRQCVACHVVQNEAGEVLAGRNARVGPNLYGVIGRQPGGLEDYDYSDLMEIYGDMEEVVWEEANFVGYVQDPTGYLRKATGETSGRSKMAYQVRDEQQAHDLYTFLAEFSPAAAGAEGEAAATDAAASE